MANSDKNIVITPNTGQVATPTIVFTGGSNTPTTLTINDNGSLTYNNLITTTSLTVSNTITGSINGNAATAGTANTLTTARTIGGVSFNGSANIDLPGVNTTGNQNTTGSAATWTTARTLTVGNTGKSVNGSANVSWSHSELGVVRDLGAVAVQAVAGSNQSCTTAQFITWLTSIGAFQQTSSRMKCTWSYAENNDISDTGFGSLETAGCIIETAIAGSEYIVRVISPSTGSGAGGIHEYINHGASYSPGWRRVYTSTLNGNISGSAASATTAATLQTARNINGTSFNGSADILETEWYHSNRDFPSGTLITTSINYAVSEGDPFVLLVEGNSYGNLIPMHLQYQGYIYSGTIINHGGYSIGYNITGLVALNVGGNLCFWFPTQGYWNGYNVKVYSAYGPRAVNKVTAITGTTKPAGTKEVALSANVRQALRTDFCAVTGSITATGDITAYFSDERLKTFEGTIPNALDKVLSLNGYYFYENELAKSLGYTNDKRQLGVSAQEVERILPEAVAPASISSEYLTVKYEKLVPLLIEAIKEQNSQIISFKTQIDNLTDQISSLQTMINTLISK